MRSCDAGDPTCVPGGIHTQQSIDWSQVEGAEFELNGTHHQLLGAAMGMQRDAAAQQLRLLQDLAGSSPAFDSDEYVQLLEEAGVRWDLIYLGGSAQYCRAAEPAVGAPGSSLLVAGHRKVCMAYALSADGARKLATCGFRASVLPLD